RRHPARRPPPAHHRLRSPLRPLRSRARLRARLGPLREALRLGRPVMTAPRPGATVTTPAGTGVVVCATHDVVRIAAAPDQIKTYLASAATNWTTVSDGSSGSSDDRFARMVARLAHEGIAQCEVCGARLSDPVSRAVGRGPECRRSAMARQRGTPEQRI